MMSRFAVVIAMLAALTHPSANAVEQGGDLQFFETHVRPLLVEHCYECHNSTDDAQGGLAVDWRGGLMDGGDSGTAIVPGKPEASLLLQVIRHEVDGLEMPEGAEKLDDKSMALVEQWIRDGANDPRDREPTEELSSRALSWQAKFDKRKDWWSLQPVVAPEIPDAVDERSHPVDRFLQRARTKAGLSSSEFASRDIVLRRLHYVLTGIPATVQEREAFRAAWVEHGREGAVQEKVDQLIASERFGERWAQHWLDWFRYTEGHGGQGDPVNENATVYRDYVIRALNANVPYDQLIREHLAGDLLAEPRLDPAGTINESIIGLAQLRFVEHGFFPVDALDELIKFTDNQIDVVSKATLGLTVSCARCHDHKFDPISQRDYYALFGIFASSRPGHRPLIAPGMIDQHREALRNQQEKLADAVKKAWLADVTTERVRDRLDAFAEAHEQLEKNPKKPVETLGGDEEIPQILRVTPGDALEPWVRWATDEEVLKNWRSLPQRLDSIRQTAQKNNQTITLATFDFRQGLPDGWRLTDGTIEAVPAGTLGLSTDNEGVVESVLPSGIITHAATTLEQAAIFSPDFQINFGALAADWSGSGWPQFRMVAENFPRPGGIYKQHDSRGDGSTRWFGEEADFWDGQRGYFQFNTRALAPAPPRGPRGDDSKFVPTTPQPHGSWFHVREVRQLRGEKDRIRREELPASILLSSESKVEPVDRVTLAERYSVAIREVVQRWRTDDFTDLDALFLTESLRTGLLVGDKHGLGDAVATELATLRKIESNFKSEARQSAPGVVESNGFNQALYERGDHRQPTEPVMRGFLDVMQPGGFKLGNESGRLQLADSLTASDNPLFPRVIANRIWLQVFGEGLVRTPDNFGHNGQPPTHPELLDHLANRLRTTGYDLKDAIRYLLATELFQLSSVPCEQAQSIDGNNRLWTHAKIRRLDAEVVHDHLLAVSGRLQSKLFGPAVVPNTPVAKDVRRAVYIARKRQGRDTFLNTFDMPLPVSTRGQRDVTTTPSQAITLLNAPLVRHQAKAWAEKHENVPAEKAIGELIADAFTRPAKRAELDSLVDFYEANGGGIAGLMETAHLVFNMKEFVYLP
jgi:hypothetical protein